MNLDQFGPVGAVVLTILVSVWIIRRDRANNDNQRDAAASKAFEAITVQFTAQSAELATLRAGLKNAFSLGGERQSATVQLVRLFNWQWESTGPITNVTFRTDGHPTDLLAAGSRVQVFGLGTFAVALAR